MPEGHLVRSRPALGKQDRNRPCAGQAAEQDRKANDRDKESRYKSGFGSVSLFQMNPAWQPLSLPVASQQPNLRAPP